MRRRPEALEYAEYYATYVKLVPDGDIVTILREQLVETLDCLAGVPAAKADHRYAPGKWTVKDVLRHIIDVEWVFTVRALSFARSDGPPLPGMDQDEYVARADVSVRDLDALVEEFRHLRSAGTLLFDSMTDAVLDRRGIASGCRFTVRAIPYIIAGHERHHLRVLKDRYLSD